MCKNKVYNEVMLNKTENKKGLFIGSNSAFTLAEVLITLAIIGIVAAMTLPALIEKHQKRVVLTRLKKFYTGINQAVRMAEAEYGDCEYWDYPTNDDYESAKVFFDKYWAPYLNVIEAGSKDILETDEQTGETTVSRTDVLVKFADGSAMRLRYSNGFDIVLYPQASKMDNLTHKTRQVFAFCFYKDGTTDEKSFVEPYTYLWDGTRENLFSHARYGCSQDNATYCAKLIQYDGWEISDDYPW